MIVVLRHPREDGPPRPAPARFPYRDHRSLDEVLLAERIIASHLRMLGLEAA